MDIKDAKILWDSGGPVKVVSMGSKETPDEKALRMSYGACNPEWAGATDEGRIIDMFSAFVSLVVRDAVLPSDAHKAFLAIDQYRENIAGDLPGASL